MDSGASPLEPVEDNPSVLSEETRQLESPPRIFQSKSGGCISNPSCMIMSGRAQTWKSTYAESEAFPRSPSAGHVQKAACMIMSGRAQTWKSTYAESEAFPRSPSAGHVQKAVKSVYNETLWLEPIASGILKPIFKHLSQLYLDAPNAGTPTQVRRRDPPTRTLDLLKTDA
ncbi:hypothetical protein T265_11828 [Opisthorchis viverrini]|uniref:Uncharacterized protein n=1 Tax=Opisthorchis viverrini TaxID=6198 RepID=A0A074YX42_OPIVI|nr:hypothetical protein T265_11828 [Opisthorchis viverrini]KER19376.1 hypothetical protein T265_11828 [Opisthorchis viverrini]